MHKLNLRIGVLLAALLLVVGLAAVPGVAFAAPEEGGDHGGGEGGLFSGDIGNAVWTLVIFGIVLFLLSKFAWGPLLSGLQSREAFIREALDNAREEREQAAAKLAEYEERLAKAREEVDAIMDEARSDADVLRQREEEKAKQDYEQMIDRAKREIEIAQETAVKDLYARAAQLATGAASAVLEREIRPEDHERLIADSIAAIDRAGDGQMGA